MRTSLCGLVLLVVVSLGAACFFHAHFPPMLCLSLVLLAAGLIGGIAWDPNVWVPWYLWRRQPLDARRPWPFPRQSVVGQPEAVYLSADGYLKRVPLSAFAKAASAGTPHLVRVTVSDWTDRFFLLGSNWRLETDRLDRPRIRMHYQPPVDKVVVDPDVTFMTKIDVPNPSHFWEDGARLVLSIVDRYHHVDEYLQDHPNHLVPA